MVEITIFSFAVKILISTSQPEYLVVSYKRISYFLCSVDHTLAFFGHEKHLSHRTVGKKWNVCALTDALPIARG